MAKKKDKKRKEPKVRDLTKAGESELSGKELDEVSGGQTLSCGHGRSANCASLVVHMVKPQLLTITI